LPPVSGADAQRSANGAKGSGGSFERGGSDVAANSVVILLDGARCHFSLQLFGRNQERKDESDSVLYVHTNGGCIYMRHALH